MHPDLGDYEELFAKLANNKKIDKIIKYVMQLNAGEWAKDWPEPVFSRNPYTLAYTDPQDRHTNVGIDVILSFILDNCQEEDQKEDVLHLTDKIMLKIARILLNCGADVDSQKCSSRTPLMEAAQEESPDAIKLVLAFKPDIEKKDSDGNTAYYHALRTADDLIGAMIHNGDDESYKWRAYRVRSSLDVVTLIKSLNPNITDKNNDQESCMKVENDLIDYFNVMNQSLKQKNLPTIKYNLKKLFEKIVK